MDDDRLTAEMVERVIGLIEEQIRDRFPIPEGQRTNPGGQRAIAEAMHLAQPTLNRLIKQREGVGLDTVLALRAYFRDIGQPMTLDEILWKQDPGQKLASDAMLARLMDLEKQAQQFIENPPSKKQAREYWKQVHDMRCALAGTIGAQRKAAAVNAKKPDPDASPASRPLAKRKAG